MRERERASESPDIMTHDLPVTRETLAGAAAEVEELPKISTVEAFAALTVCTGGESSSKSKRFPLPPDCTAAGTGALAGEAADVEEGVSASSSPNASSSKTYVGHIRV